MTTSSALFVTPQRTRNLPSRKAEGYHTFPRPRDAAHTEIVEYWREDPLVALQAPWMESRRAAGVPGKTSSVTRFVCVAGHAAGTVRRQRHLVYVNMPEDKMPSEEEMEKTYANVLHRVKGTTFFPAKSRKNAPYQKVSKAEMGRLSRQKEVTQVEEEQVNGCPIR